MSIDHSHTADWEALAEMDKQSPDASHPMTVAGRVLADELRVHLPCQDDVTLGLVVFRVAELLRDDALAGASGQVVVGRMLAAALDLTALEWRSAGAP